MEKNGEKLYERTCAQGYGRKNILNNFSGGGLRDAATLVLLAIGVEGAGFAYLRRKF